MRVRPAAVLAALSVLLVGAGVALAPVALAVPPAPGCLTAVAGGGTRTVALDWNDVAWAAGSTGRAYEVHEDLFNGVDNLVATVTVSNRTSGTVAAGTYRYYIVAKDSTGRSTVSPKLTVTVPVSGTVTSPVGCNPNAVGDGRDPLIPASIPRVFAGDYEPGNLSQWETAQTRNFNSSPGTATSINGYSIQVQSTGQAEGSYGARFELRDGDVPPFGGDERAELSASTTGAAITDGEEAWVEQWIKFDSTFTCPTDWFLVQQWRSGPASPASALNVDSACNLNWGNNVTGQSLTVGNVGRGSWHKYVFHVKFSQSATVGYVEAWQDGVRKIALTHLATMDASTGYIKQGIYRSAALSTTAVVSHDGLHVYKAN